MLKVVLTFFFFFYYISRTHTGCNFAPSSTRLLYLYFIWNPNRVVIALDFGSDGRGLDSHQRRSYFSVPDMFFKLQYS